MAREKKTTPEQPAKAASDDPEDKPQPAIDLDLQTDDTDNSADLLAVELAQARTDATKYKDRWQRTTADLENYRKRVARDRDRDRLREKARLLKQLLEVLDIFDKALEVEYEDVTQAHEGMVRILTNITKVMRNEGLEPVPAQGLPFDASSHEALASIPTNEAEPGTVLEEVQLGYTLEGQLLRPAKVVVAKEAPLEDLSRPEANSDEAEGADEGPDPDQLIDDALEDLDQERTEIDELPETETDTTDN